MKHSDIFVKNGIIYNEITDIIKKATVAHTTNILVICNDEEIFDQANQTVMNRYPQARGLVLAPNPGFKMGKRNTIIKFYSREQGLTYSIEIMTKAEYLANKAAIDAKTYDSKHTIMWTGGEN